MLKYLPVSITLTPHGLWSGRPGQEHHHHHHEAEQVCQWATSQYASWEWWHHASDPWEPLWPCCMNQTTNKLSLSQQSYMTFIILIYCFINFIIDYLSIVLLGVNWTMLRQQCSWTHDKTCAGNLCMPIHTCSWTALHESLNSVQLHPRQVAGWCRWWLQDQVHWAQDQAGSLQW